MPRFNPRDVKEIVDMLEDGIISIPKLTKIEKMKMRSKIRNQYGWISALSNPHAGMIYQRLEERLCNIFPLYPCDLRDKLKKLLKEKSKRLVSP